MTFTMVLHFASGWAQRQFVVTDRFSGCNGLGWVFAFLLASISLAWPSFFSAEEDIFYDGRALEMDIGVIALAST